MIRRSLIRQDLAVARSLQTTAVVTPCLWQALLCTSSGRLSGLL